VNLKLKVTLNLKVNSQKLNSVKLYVKFGEVFWVNLTKRCFIYVLYFMFVCKTLCSVQKSRIQLLSSVFGPQYPIHKMIHVRVLSTIVFRSPIYDLIQYWHSICESLTTIPLFWSSLDQFRVVFLIWLLFWFMLFRFMLFWFMLFWFMLLRCYLWYFQCTLIFAEISSIILSHWSNMHEQPASP